MADPKAEASRDGTPSELRELAGEVLDLYKRGNPGAMDAGTPLALARGLLSALDALEAANERLQEGGNHALRLLDRASAAEAALEAANKKADCGGVNCGRCQQCLTVTLHFALEAVDNLKDERDKWKRAHKVVALWLVALAGVPGGSPEEPHGDGPCALCGRNPAAGFASIGDDWYCHGDDDPDPTCYMRSQRLVGEQSDE